MDGLPTGRTPAARVCYICGRQYGLKSIEIHQVQCRRLFEAQQAKLPPGERKALPPDPGAGLLGGGGGGDDDGGGGGGAAAGGGGNAGGAAPPRTKAEARAALEAEVEVEAPMT